MYLVIFEFDDGSEKQVLFETDPTQEELVRYATVNYHFQLTERNLACWVAEKREIEFGVIPPLPTKQSL